MSITSKVAVCQPQVDLRFSDPPSGQGAEGGARTRDRMVSADLTADSLSTMLPTPLPANIPENEFSVGESQSEMLCTGQRSKRAKLRQS
ncbi:hypothetical protein PoB_000546100 [Plakobranchus ocellatus]|uniref:Uncharacterized protein n=1 Tax=Plakobranchus ocellatus TaxID=259542 RepID=A0AAV3Y968_9GAST|nr:hypothetical protein PoB_000546100 [Plakobranchus ocellatus]